MTECFVNSNIQGCHKTANILNVTVCVTEESFKHTDKVAHIAGVLAQLLDNDADGVIDDPAVAQKMKQDEYILFVGTETEDLENYPNHGKTTTQEAHPNSCDVPTNRGASTRSTWLASRNGYSGCVESRDATVEEVLHLISKAASNIYPDTWGQTYTSTVGQQLQLLNGNCGHGTEYKHPDTCTGWYAYSDESCDEGCIIDEGIYWASVTWMGGFFTDRRAYDEDTTKEWLLPVPDNSMASALQSTTYGQIPANAKTLQDASPTLYNMISDTTSEGHKWLPSVMPNGNYQRTLCGSPTGSPTGPTGPTSSGSGLTAGILVWGLLVWTALRSRQ